MSNMGGQADRLHTGHRQRQMDKYKELGLAAFTDVEALELLLYYVIPQRDTNPLAHQILNACGNSFRKVLEADWKDLTAIKGVGERTAVLLSLVRELNLRYARSERRFGEHLPNVEEVGAYLRRYFDYASSEKLVMLSLDVSNCLIGEHLLAEGLPDQVELPLRVIVEHALHDKARGVILAHNHLDHNALPSHADIRATQLLQHALQLVDVKLLDHIVVADDDFVSILESGGLG